MRSGEMGCMMMIQKKPSRSLWPVAQGEGRKGFEGRVDGNCRQARWFCEETFLDEGVKRECEGVEGRLIGN